MQGMLAFTILRSERSTAVAHLGLAAPLQRNAGANKWLGCSEGDPI